MAQNIPIYIPTYIGDQNYGPARVLPRLLFYNGNVDCQTYYLQGTTGFQAVGTPVSSVELNKFPYFDNYSAETGSFPTTGSKSLLFFNEDSLYGSTPTASLYSEFWDEYVQLLYNPRTRLLNATAIIPLADYFQIELNDIVSFRGEFWHLRYINDYNLKNGECVIQLLGPIYPQALPFSLPPDTPSTTTSTSTSTTTTTLPPCEYNGITIDCVTGTTTTSTSTSTSTSTTSTTTQCPVNVNDCYLWTFTRTAPGPDNQSFTYLPCGSRTITTGIVGATPVTVCGVDGLVKPFSQLTEEDVCNGYTVGRSGNDSSITVSKGAACTTTTSTTTEFPYTEFTGCGEGNNVSAACNDALINNRTFYSNCNSSTLGAGCTIYSGISPVPTALTGYSNAFMNGVSWDINSSTGVIINASSVQC
jgi:hypothetical protein